MLATAWRLMIGALKILRFTRRKGDIHYLMITLGTERKWSLTDMKAKVHQSDLFSLIFVLIYGICLFEKKINLLEFSINNYIFI